jgi:hypothetical protein
LASMYSFNDFSLSKYPEGKGAMFEICLPLHYQSMK